MAARVRRCVVRAVLQRVTSAKVEVAAQDSGQQAEPYAREIGPGIMALIGAGHGDTEQDLAYIVDKLVNLRIFDDADGKMNRSLLETSGGVLWVSQFTLYGDARKGRRPGFTDAMAPGLAQPLWARGVDLLRQRGVRHVAAGVFGANMQVSLCNDGPVTILLDSRKTF